MTQQPGIHSLYGSVTAVVFLLAACSADITGPGRVLQAPTNLTTTSLDGAVDALTEVGARIERLRMVAGAARRYAETEDEGERERAQRALLLALEELDRHVIPTAPDERAVTSRTARPPDDC